MAHVATLTIDHTKVAADLTDFPVAVIANGDAGWAELYALATEGGGDIRVFKSDDTTELPREIVSFSVSAETGEIHVKYSGTLSSTVDTDIHIYADGTSSDYGPTDTYGRNAVWTNSFSAVYHLSSTDDSTGNGQDGTATSISYVAGKVGNSASLNGTNSVITKSSSGLPSGGSARSINVWFNKSADGKTAFFYGTNATGGMIAFNIDGTGINLYGITSPYDLSHSVTVSSSAWHRMAMTNDGTTTKLFFNGSMVASKTITYATTASSTMRIGDGTGWFTSFWQGLLDEIRIASVARSDDWQTTEYNNQNSPGTFYAVTAVTATVIDQALTATAQASAVFVRQVQREMSVTASAIVDFTRSVGRLLNVTAQATASFVRSVGRTLQVTAQGSPTLQAGLLYATELIATAQATASIAYTQVTIVAMTVTAQASTAITQIYARVRALTATASATASVVRNSTLARTLVATASATASLVQSGLIISRELLVTASATVTFTALKTLSYVMSVTVGAVVSLLKDFGYVDKYPENDATYEDKYPTE